MAAHSYWRIRSLGTTGNYVHFNTVEMRATIGGADQCSGGTPIEIGHQGGSFAPNAFDGSGSTYWEYYNAALTGQPGGLGWVGYQFASPVDVEEVRLRAATFTPTEQATHCLLEYSDDGVTWYGKTRMRPAWAANAYDCVIATPDMATRTGARYWRLNVNLSQSSNYRMLAEIDMLDALGVSTALGIYAIATHNQSGIAYNLFANDGLSSQHEGLAGGNPANFYWTWDLGFGFADVCKTLKIQASNTLSENPKDFTLEYSYDNITWFTSVARTGEAAWTSGEIRTYATTDDGTGGIVPPGPSSRRRPVIVAT